MNTITLDQAIDTVLQLPPEQQDILLDILRHRQTEIRRKQIAADAQQAIMAFHQGESQTQTADELIAELCLA